MKREIRGIICLFLAMLMAASCSDNSKMKGLLEQVPADADVVLVGSVKTVLESAGGKLENSQIILPAFISDNLSQGEKKDFDEANVFLKDSGIDPEACAVIGTEEHGNGILVFSISDKDKFLKAIEAKGYKKDSETGDVVAYSMLSGISYYYFVVNDTYAYYPIDGVWVESDFKPIPYLRTMIEKAGQSNFADTQFGDYILEGNVGGLAFRLPKSVKERKLNDVPAEVKDLLDGVFCLRGNLTDDKCTVELGMFEKDGSQYDVEKLKKYLNVNASISEDALAMLGKDEFVVYAVSLKDFNWSNYLDLMSSATSMSRFERARMNAFTGYLEKIDGTAALGFGVKNGIESFNNMNDRSMLTQMSATLVVETKEGKAKQLVEDMKGLLEQLRVPFSETDDGFSIKTAQIGLEGDISVRHDGDIIALANHPIAKDNANKVVKAFDITDCLFAICVALDKDNKLLRDVSIDSDVNMALMVKSGNLNSSLTIEIKGGDSKEGVIAKAAKIILALKKM